MLANGINNLCKKSDSNIFHCVISSQAQQNANMNSRLTKHDLLYLLLICTRSIKNYEL